MKNTHPAHLAMLATLDGNSSPSAVAAATQVLVLELRQQADAAVRLSEIALALSRSGHLDEGELILKHAKCLHELVAATTGAGLATLRLGSKGNR